MSRNGGDFYIGFSGIDIAVLKRLPPRDDGLVNDCHSFIAFLPDI
jgi:hypothetical protein